jgi:hypothetical protein
VAPASSCNVAGTPSHGCDAPMGLESPFAYGGYGPWSNRLQRRVLAAPSPLERGFCAHFALVCLSCPSRRLLTSPSYRISGTPHAGATASGVAPVPAHISGIIAAAAAAIGGLSGVAAAFFRRFWQHAQKWCRAVCVLCGVRFGRCEPQATPARVLAGQTRPTGAVRACFARQERRRSPGRAAARVRSRRL